MKTLDRYILGRLLVTFLITQGVITGIIWVTQSLRQLDLVSSKGQTILQFFHMTLMVTPFLIMNIIPFALVISITIVLNSLRSDSELNSLFAAGVSRMLLFRPFFYFATIIAIVQCALAAYGSSFGLKAFREELVRVRLDLVANIVQPGQFQHIGSGLIFHIKNRLGDGLLEGIVLDDRRDPEKYINYVSPHGQITEVSGKTLLVMNDGTFQRYNPNTGAMSIVQFETYAFDLTSMIPQQTELTFKPSERSLVELLTVPEDDPYYIENKDHFGRELVDRLTVPLYIYAYTVLVFAFLGLPATTRTSREIAIIQTLFGCMFVQVLKFGMVNLSTISILAQIAAFVLPIAVFFYTLWNIRSDRTTAVGSKLTRAIELSIIFVQNVLSRLSSQKPNEEKS